MATTPQQRIRDFYGFDFPDDFFRFAEFMKELPEGLLRDVYDMTPAYPFALASGMKPTDFPDNPFWEDRYYHDLPEFITLFNGSTDGLHYGYFFDAPGELPPVVVMYWHSDCFQHSCNGDTLFEAVRWRVEKAECDFQDMLEDDAKEAAYYQKRLVQTDRLRTRLAQMWGSDRSETGNDYLDNYDGSSWRRPVAETWDDLGIVLDRAQYKPLKSNPIKKPQANPTRPSVERAVKEARKQLAAGFPGTALKLGRDLWVWAKDYPGCYELLDAAYAALGREPLRRLMAEARAWRARCDELTAMRGK